jgi:predicted MFS family arabinose efflux permease
MLGAAMGFPASLRALDHRDFRLFLTAQGISQVGTWMHSVAMAWLVLSLTDSPLRLGLINTIQWGPILLFSVITGAVADRLPKRRLLMLTQGGLALTTMALALLVLSGHVQYWHIAILALASGLANTLDNPARQSFVVEMVGRADLVNAVALNSASFNAARIVGPALGGLLIARFGVVPAFVLNSLSFVLVLAALASMTARGPWRRTGGTTIRQEIMEGLRYALRTPRIRLVLSILLVVSFCVFNLSVYVPLLARNVLGQGPRGFGFLMAAVGVGAVTGALLLGAVVPRRPPIPLLFATGMTACAGLALMSVVREFWLAVPVLFVIGFAGVATTAGCNSALQLAASDALRGRVMSLYTLIFGGSFPIAAFLVGAISERWSVSTAFLAGGTTGLVGLTAVLAWQAQRTRV